ncbi:methyl-accepting chemotaxis protein [Geobacter sulfurreducens]|uniref:Methyl-accepting chemotaxis sensory transducer, class 34H-related protein n=1 Tax=Geobacter sulfurreducens (strain ATCC 51573 / DSM 12127 / PCA) TaxID=243231 RepID=Q74DM9_GEOSL|nr:methyl-accepting chemotaxis sensory transducer, class 34H-related protein [Geobacter sulfurreducens PCA]QVW36501.1 methyl-accepting chemotaxis protein [Geobacter sulfurreducens]UAC05315.1 methyl-accepting chemotaxis protein [Geobacter sulfurreducens]HCD97364.1 methyl-accepting chemotaxis protein [Geobacter sulfurreducens]
MEGPERLDTVAFDLFRRFRQDGAEAGCPPGGAPSAVADDSLLRELQVWKSCLADAGDRLQQVTGSTEEEFLAVGARLHEFYSRAGDIERMTRGVAENVLGDEFGSDMKSLSAILDRIAAYLGQADSQTEQLTQTLRSVLELIDRVDTPLEGFRKIIKNLHMLSTAVKIESARLGEGAAGFNTLAEDVERLSVSIKEKSTRILGEKDSLGRVITDTLESISRIEASQREDVRRIISETGENLGALSTLHARCSDVANNVATLSAEIADSIGEVVTSLQFHDITRQQIEHVKEALEDVVRHLDNPGDNPQGDVAEAAEVCDLQLAQLLHSRDELVSAVERIILNLRDIVAKETRMSEETRGITGSADQTGHSFFARMEDEMASVSRVLTDNVRAKRDTASAMTLVVSSVNDISAFVTDIEEIGTEIELIALNSQVKAANTGDGGAALGVLAESIQHLSVDARTRTGDVSVTLREVTEVTGRLVMEVDADVSSGTDEIERLLVELKRLLDSVESINSRLLGLLADMDSAVGSLSTDIEAATSGLSVHNTAGALLDEVATALEETLRDMRRAVPAATRRGNGGKLLDLAQRYTMHSERTVHHRVVGGGTPAVATGATASPGDGLGDNVELF